MPFAYTAQTIPDGVAGTYATVDQIVALIRAGTNDPNVRLIAAQAIASCPWKQKLCEAQAIFDWIKQNIRFTYDPEGAELLQDVTAILTYRSADCDDMVILGAALLRSVGIPVRIVIIASDPRYPDLFSHIYLQVWTGSPRGWAGFDPSVTENMQVGWEPPRFTRKQVIPIQD